MAQEKDFKNKIIMVVDDDESVLSFLSFSLKSEGFQVISVDTAEHAFESLKAKVPDLILLDIMLPHMDGFTMCNQLRQDSRFEKTPIIFITAYADPTTLDKTKEVGAQGLIEKPIMFDELYLQVLDALNGKFSLPTRLKFRA